jgi:hypothetical protein
MPYSGVVSWYDLYFKIISPLDQLNLNLPRVGEWESEGESSESSESSESFDQTQLKIFIVSVDC